VLSSSSLRATDPAFRAAAQEALRPVRSDPSVARVRTAYDTPHLNPELISSDGRRTLAIVEMNGTFEEADDAYPALRDRVTSPSLEVLATGGIPLQHDFDRIIEQDLYRAEVYSLPLALLMLLLVFGSLVASGLPLGVGVLAVAAGFVGTLLLARVTDVSIYATNIVTMIGLGVAIDYSLFVVSRFREEVLHRPVPEALAHTMATAGRAVLFSGLTVAIGLGGLVFFRLGDLGSMGLAGTIVVALAVLYALTFLPALLALLGPRVNAARVPFLHPERTGMGSGLWHRIARGVMARPWAVLLPVVVLLLFLGSPVLRMRLWGGDYTFLPEHAEGRRGAELLLGQFPGQDTNPVVVVLRFADGSPLAPERFDRLRTMSAQIAALPSVTMVESPADAAVVGPPEQLQQLLSQPAETVPVALHEVREGLARSAGARVAVLTAHTPYRSSTEEARDLVHAVRTLDPGAGAEILVTGQAAYDIDSIEAVKRDAPVAIGFIVIATYLVLFLLLGSILLPLKAVLMNFLSIAASYGALVWIFQDGHLSNVLGFTPNPIETSTPVLMFCILFGLSMDYEVLLLARVKEEWERTGDNTHSVAVSLERTGRLITGAAAIMAVVFFSFATAETVVIKAIGLGMAIAVVLDATVVRALLVPATMRLLGRWNWWAPAPLARLYDRLGLAERSSDAPEPQVPAV
ncbi:MAG: MMPL family transporter, partial [Chloroflexota bacterium]|nr:MMPL family transporter [Chloroflexota bacterium]